MSENKEVLVKAYIKKKDSNETIKTNKFNLSELNQLNDKDNEFVLIGGYVVPKWNISSIRVEKVESEAV